jgi:EAL domain-containing protein (putative c-di-GMP-specific phosphodiesterase class I)
LARLRAANAVTAAARSRAFHFDYQPVVHLPDRRPVAVEALMRWDTGEDLARPDAFIPIADSIGELTNILRDLLPVALADIVRLRQEAPDLALTVNVHAGALLDDDLDTWLMAQLESAGLPPHALILEMSERALIPAQAARTLASLRARGIQAWIDDFGTGWSNLSSLERLPVNGVKLAREIVVDTAGGLKSDLVAAASALATAVGFSVIAEGVELPDQMPQLHRLGVDAVQGYAVARAMSLPDTVTWVRSAV